MRCGEARILWRLSPVKGGTFADWPITRALAADALSFRWRDGLLRGAPEGRSSVERRQGPDSGRFIMRASLGQCGLARNSAV